MRRRAEKLMKTFDMDIDVEQNLEEYSLALQQMIAIARAVDMDCKVLILDEPTSSLDEKEVLKLFSLMEKLRDQGVGIIFCHTLFGAGLRCVRPYHRTSQRQADRRIHNLAVAPHPADRRDDG